MGKQAKGKGSGAKTPITGRPQPYTKKPKVEVKFEGVAPAKSSKSTPASSQTAKSKQAQPVVNTSAPATNTKDKGKAKASDSVPALTPGSFIVVAGSYEKLLYGIEGTYAPGSETPSFKPIFIFPAHLACVKAVAASPGGKWLATGSEDEFVKVWDLRRRKEVGSLSQHTGRFR
jgi:protein MAK11